MRRLFLAAIMCCVTASVQAADLPDLPVLRGALTERLASTNVNWHGFYLGVQGGYGSSDENFAGTNTNLLTDLLDHNILNEMQLTQWNLVLGKKSARTSAYGAFTGYNSQWDDVVIGLEANYMHGSFGGASHATKTLTWVTPLSDGLFHRVTVDSSASIAISDMATFRGRAAYAWGCFLPYMFGGFALGNADIARTVIVRDAVGIALTGPFSPRQPLTATNAVHNHLIYGYSGGLGIDINLTGGLFMRAEWEYVRFTAAVDTSINTVRAGVGYKF